MKIDLIAYLKTYQDFIDSYQEGDEKIGGILISALSNTKPFDRYQISKFLIDKGADVTELGSQGYSSLQVLLAQVKHNLDETYDLCKLLVEHGVDVNHRDPNGQVAFTEIIRMGEYSDSELEKLYDLFFSQPEFRLDYKNRFGKSPFDFAESRPNRATLLERMKEYVARQAKDASGD